MFLSKNLINTIKSSFFLATLDLKIKYRRTYLGPWWNTLTILFVSFIISIVWGIVLKNEFNKFFYELFINLTIWFYIISVLVESTEVFSKKFSKILINTSLPIENHVFRSCFYNFVLYAHNLPLIVLLYFFNIEFNFIHFLFYIIGMFLIFINSFLIILVIGFICARFRDIAALIKMITAPLMLVTPIIWKKEQLGQYELYAYLNPFTSYVELISFPLLGKEITYLPYAINFLILLILGLMTLVIYKKYKQRLGLWSN
jgi:lipopolysaccharide transport system permease protein